MGIEKPFNNADSEEDNKQEEESVQKQPEFVREFSKEYSQEERQALAGEIMEKRGEYFERKKTIEEIKSLNEQLDAYNDSSFISKIGDYLKIRAVRRKLEVKESMGEESGSSNEMEEVRNMVDNFYDEQREKWAESEYSKEDIVNNFSEEHLSKLSLEDYITLLKRFPSEMVTHVTRQGIRDHFGMTYHTKGRGEYSDSFMKMLEDGHLKSPLAVTLMENGKKKGIEQILRLDSYKTKNQALERLDAYTREDQDSHNEIIGEYVDTAAIHFAVEEVADHYYGSERGNEIFVAYPSALVASQYYFSMADSGGSVAKMGKDAPRNDLWTWTQEENGIDLNAGLVFIPADAQVDAKNGSQYELDEHKNPVPNQEYKKQINKIADTGYNINLFDRLLRSMRERETEATRVGDLENASVLDKDLQRVLLDRVNLEDLQHICHQKYDAKKFGDESRLKKWEQELDRKIKEILINNDLYENAKNTISSKSFWEAYFTEHPDKTPSKVVYYKGGDPTKALDDFRMRNDIYKSGADKNLGFVERHVSRKSEFATKGMNRFRNLAADVIDQHYEKTS